MYALYYRLILRDFLKRDLNELHIRVLFATTGCDEWTLKLLTDQQLIGNLLVLPENDFVMRLFVKLAQHPGFLYIFLIF
jgi:hypothetical protein